MFVLRTEQYTNKYYILANYSDKYVQNYEDLEFNHKIEQNLNKTKTTFLNYFFIDNNSNKRIYG